MSFFNSNNIHPNSLANIGLGDLEFEGKKIYNKDLVLEYYSKAISLDSESYVPYRKMALLYFDLSEWENAEMYYSKSIKLGNKIASDFANLIYVNIVLKNYTKSFTLINESYDQFGYIKEIAFFELVLKSLNNNENIVDKELYNKYVNSFDVNKNQLDEKLISWGIKL
jgi:hypothetical protein